MQRIKVGVVGVGHLGQHHGRIYSQLPKIELVGVVDVNEERVKEIAQRFSTSPYLNYKELRGKVEAVSIAVPTFLHYKIARDFLKWGIHILVEKPFTQTVEEAEELLSLAKKKERILQVGHIERFNTAIEELEKRIENPRFIESHRLGPFKERGTDVGVVLDLMIHDIDIILNLVHSEVSQIDASGVSVLSQKEDIANARLKFANGCVANITASRLTKEEVRRIRIFQDNTYISLDYLKQELLIYRKIQQKIVVEKPFITKQEPLKRELESFVECVRCGTSPLVSGEQGKKALEVVDKILQQIGR